LILVEKKRISIEMTRNEWLARAGAHAPMREALLTHEIARASRTVDLPHQDPADRFLVATACVLGLMLVTADERILNSSAVSVMPNRRVRRK